MVEDIRNQIAPESDHLKESRFTWYGKWKEIRVEKNEDGGAWLSLYYDEDLGPKEKEALKVKEKMPFEVMFELDQDYNHLCQAFGQDSGGKGFYIGSRESGVKEHDHEIFNQFLASEIEKTLQQSSLSFFWHGWASDPRVWTQTGLKEFLKRNIDSRSDTNKNRKVVNIMPSGMNIGGKKDECWVNQADCFTPRDYGDQMVEFVDRYFGWDKQLDFFGHSMGGIGILWAAKNILENARFRIMADKLPNLRLWSIAPAYPQEANIFITPDLKVLLTAGRILVHDPITSWVAEQISQIKNRMLLKGDIYEQFIDIHSQIAALRARVLTHTMRGLSLQEEFDPQTWNHIVTHFPLVRFTDPDDIVVDESQSNQGFDKLGSHAFYLGLTMQNLLSVIEEGSGHYPRPMLGPSRILHTSITSEREYYPFLDLPQFLDLIPAQYTCDYLEIFRTTLVLYGQMGDKRQKPDGVSIFFELAHKKDLPEDITRKLASMIAVKNLLAYYSLATDYLALKDQLT